MHILSSYLCLMLLILKLGRNHLILFKYPEPAQSLQFSFRGTTSLRKPRYYNLCNLEEFNNTQDQVFAQFRLSPDTSVQN